MLIFANFNRIMNMGHLQQYFSYNCEFYWLGLELGCLTPFQQYSSYTVVALLVPK